MKRFFGLLLERLVFLSQNLEVGKWRKKRKLRNRKTKAAVSERRRLFRYPVRSVCRFCVLMLGVAERRRSSTAGRRRFVLLMLANRLVEAEDVFRSPPLSCVETTK